MDNWTKIAAEITRVTQKPFQIKHRHFVSGGCINQGYQVSGNDATYFVKLNNASGESMFAAEAKGLQQILATKTIRVPQPICWGSTANSSYLVLEWLKLGGGGDKPWEKMGRQLAAMHQKGGADRFGWERNNTIGFTPQINTWTANWGDFFAEHRIGYQLKLAKRRGGNFPDTTKVVAAVKQSLAGISPQPALVHGDLWRGNAGVTSGGEPVIFDPATYYGDREVDLAMTELFGSFPPAFYRGYNQVWRLNEGYRQRKSIYNLYHILNHFNLFGGGYGSQANYIIQEILS